VQDLRSQPCDLLSERSSHICGDGLLHGQPVAQEIAVGRDGFRGIREGEEQAAVRSSGDPTEPGADGAAE
jgi:hypothetical protein